MLCTWDRCSTEPASWERDAEKVQQHRARSLTVLRIFDHLLCAASAASIACLIASLMG